MSDGISGATCPYSDRGAGRAAGTVREAVHSHGVTAHVLLQQVLAKVLILKTTQDIFRAERGTELTTRVPSTHYLIRVPVTVYLSSDIVVIYHSNQCNSTFN